MKRIKVNGVPTDEITGVTIIRQDPKSVGNRIYKGVIHSNGYYLSQLMDSAFTLEVDGVVYKNCNVSNSSTGDFIYMP